ncbi:hypothetical protein Ae168Ps1_1022 [Pseudonocardia sp. Ae168_Ps1]|nr:hypothetical protein Ae150APs1_1022 [Pseudonocardia sp. Ae150A_Ps1]OLL78616.1 hypothetical protein Ae168Ps1_1022 [Pseudonocardia sp. Ae168_Ps1]OLL87256.1 hypothetical protein Ae263Ps1_4311c [Pseudonocardia sp. Ae263_Ps1]OLL92713.1 hypothetical protein Ae356Ps1_2610 [Pseudonocardia sp. Ae356_Ps1]
MWRIGHAGTSSRGGCAIGAAEPARRITTTVAVSAEGSADPVSATGGRAHPAQVDVQARHQPGVHDHGRSFHHGR